MCLFWSASCIVILTHTFGTDVLASTQEKLTNKHLVIATEAFPPFVELTRNDDGEVEVKGVLWDYVKFWLTARNCTYDLVISNYGSAGHCAMPNNCSGVLGMVNRNEVDLAISRQNELVWSICFYLVTFLGPFPWNINDKKSVDFTHPFHIGYSTLIVPVLLQADIWSITHPFSTMVWYAAFISMPIFVAAMVLANYVYYRKINLTESLGFVIRNAFSEHSDMPSSAKTYQKLLIIVWLASVFVIVQSYSGNLTAMLTAPGLPTPIRNAEEFLNQGDISLVLPFQMERIISSYKTSFSDIHLHLVQQAPVSRQLTLSEYIKYGCFTTEQYDHGKIAAIGVDGHFWTLTASHFSRTGHCKFYETSDRFFIAPVSVGAFQVRFFYMKFCLDKYIEYHSRKEVRMFKTLTS